MNLNDWNHSDTNSTLNNAIRVLSETYLFKFFLLGLDTFFGVREQKESSSFSYLVVGVGEPRTLKGRAHSLELFIA